MLTRCITPALAFACVLTFVSRAGAQATVPSPQPMYSWRGMNGSGVFPAKDLVSEFWDIAADAVTSVKDAKGNERKLTLPGAPGSRKNIVWRTTLPHLGQNTPVAVKDRVFVLCQEGWKSDAPLLVCCDVKDGKILWQQPVDHLDAWPADKAAEARTWRAKEHARWRKAMTWWNKLYWDNEKNGWAEFTPEQVAPIAAAAKKDGVTLNPAYDDRPDGTKVVRRPGGVSGGFRGRYGLTGNNVAVDGQDDVHHTCNKNRYYWYPGWTSEGPFFGSCMGSVVSDGSRVYAVTALDGAACFDLDGKRLWVADLEGKQLVNYPASASRVHNSMASPVLAGGKLIYYHHGAVEFIALDAQTGRLAWRTPGPLKAGKPQHFQVAGTPIGYECGGYGTGHMAPGGTPVVMVLGGTPVVISGHGMVCRIADGKFLGQVGFPAALAKTSKSDEEGLVHASDYPSWVAQGDTLYAVALGRLIAVRLGLKGDTITQEMAWNLDAVCTGMGEGSNPVILGQTVYVSQGKPMSVKALDAATGKILASGPGVAGYTTNLGFTRDLAVWKGGKFDQSMSSSDKDKGVVTYTVAGVPDLKPRGKGYLWPEKPAGEIAERHIAALGTPRLTLSNSGLACWGNRIFIRDNDYLWCIGDPAKPFVPPEQVKP